MTDLQKLIAVHAPARAAIVTLRERVVPSATGPVEREAFHDWTHLNTVLGESDRTLAWFDSVPETSRARFDSLFELRVIPLLIEAGRWADVATLYPDPLGRLDDEALAGSPTARGSA